MIDSDKIKDKETGLFRIKIMILCFENRENEEFKTLQGILENKFDEEEFYLKEDDNELELLNRAEIREFQFNQYITREFLLLILK